MAAFSYIPGAIPKISPVSSNSTGCEVYGDCSPIASDQQHISPRPDSGTTRVWYQNWTGPVGHACDADAWRD